MKPNIPFPQNFEGSFKVYKIANTRVLWPFKLLRLLRKSQKVAKSRMRLLVILSSAYGVHNVCKKLPRDLKNNYGVIRLHLASFNND